VLERKPLKSPPLEKAGWGGFWQHVEIPLYERGTYKEIWQFSFRHYLKELVSGGLIRSLGGWSSVLGLRRRGEKQTSDTRILGDGEFVQEVTSDLDDLVKKNLRLSGRHVDIVTLAGRVCKKHGISLGELCSGSRRREIMEARGIVSWIAVRELGYSGADVARYLGVTSSCVTKSVLSGKRPDVRDYINQL
jgi:hypothetical protein